jgi:hypothetical protein
VAYYKLGRVDARLLSSPASSSRANRASRVGVPFGFRSFLARSTCRGDSSSRSSSSYPRLCETESEWEAAGVEGQREEGVGGGVGETGDRLDQVTDASPMAALMNIKIGFGNEPRAPPRTSFSLDLLDQRM